MKFKLYEQENCQILINKLYMKIFRQAIGSIGHTFARENTPEDKQQRSKSSQLIFEIDNQYMTPDFLFQEPQTTRAAKQKLTKAFFYSLSDYESRLVTNKSLELIDAVISMYQKCIEWYDSKQDPIKFYFMEKIQKVFCDKTLVEAKMQSEQLHRNLLKLDEAISQKTEDEFHDVIENSQDSKKKIVEKEQSPQQAQWRPSLDLEKIFKIQMDSERQQSQIQAREMANQNASESLQKEQLITEELSSQERSIQERLKQRSRGRRI